MTAEAKPWYQDKATLQKELNKHRTFTGLARAHGGVSADTLSDWARRLEVTLPGISKPFNPDAPDAAELLEAENAELRATVKQLRSSAVRNARLEMILERMIPKAEQQYAPPPPAKADKKFTEHEFVLMWSDLHAAEIVNAEQMGGVNEYDWGVMLQRHDKMVAALESFKNHRPYPVHTLHIAGLGDMVTGDIHDELRVTNEMVVMESALQLGLDGAAFIERLVPLFDRITFDGIVGNHGRTQKKPQMKNQHDNFDWMVYKLIELRLANYPSVEVRVPKAPFTSFTVLDKFRCFCFHGDGITTNMPGIPWGGVQRRSRELERQFEPVMGKIDHFLLGHFHQPNVVDNRRIIVNGSVKGPDEYSIKRYGAGSPASQNLLTFHPERGLTDVSYLDLQ